MEITELKIWLAVQLIIDFLFVILIVWYLLRTSKDLEFKILKSSSAKLDKILSPFLKDAKNTAADFDSIVKEKRAMVKELNETLDNRISSLNFLINRAENILEKDKQRQFSREISPDTESRDEKILELYEQGFKNEDIAKKLGISSGEVAMIISLRKKFNSLNHHGR